MNLLEIGYMRSLEAPGTKRNARLDDRNKRFARFIRHARYSDAAEIALERLLHMIVQGAQQPDMPFHIRLKCHADSGRCRIRANIDMIDAERHARLFDELIEFVQQVDTGIAAADVNSARSIAIMAGLKRWLDFYSVFPA